MKKRKFRFFVCAAILGLGLSSCAVVPSGGGGGDTPSELEERQREIYQLAVSSGYQGTYEEWLNSIRGESGSSILFGNTAPSASLGKAGDGYLDTSTWDVYFKSANGWQKMGNIMGRDGKDGNDGKDGVSITSIVKTGQEDNIDTYTITYSDGNTTTFTVTNGKDGESIQGEPGKDGHTPKIEIKDGYWYIDDVSTGIVAVGQQGEPGKDGKTPYIGENGNWWIGDEDTGYKAEGEPGHSPKVEIIDGYWYIDGVNTGIRAAGQQGEPGTSHVVSIVDGYWYIDDQNTGVPVTGEKGDTAWSNTILPANHGYVTVNCGSSLVGERVTFYAYPDEGYELTALYMNNINVIEDVIYFGTYYMYDTAMVEHGYVVRAIFAPITYTATFLDYEGLTLAVGEIPMGRYLYSFEYIDLANRRLYKPSDSDYDYEFIGWTASFGVTLPAEFSILLEQDTVFEPLYNAVPKQDTKTKYGVEHEGTYDDPFTNEDAIIVTKAIAKDPKSADASKTFYIKGLIDRFYNAPENRSDGKVSFYLQPATPGGEQFEIYGARNRADKFYGFDELYRGVEVLASGRLVMYGDQPETDYTYIEDITYYSEPPVMETIPVSVTEAIAVARGLQDGDTTYDKYAITGYVVNVSLSNYGIPVFHLSDDPSDTTNVFLVEPYLNYEKSMISSYFQYGARITITDHIRNSHDRYVQNRYEILPSMVELLSPGTSWPGMPKETTFYNEEHQVVDYVEIEVGKTVSLTYEFDIANPIEAMLRFSDRLSGAKIVKFEQGQLVIQANESGYAWETGGDVTIFNIFGELIGLLHVYVVPEYLAPEAIYCDYSESTVYVGDSFFAGAGNVHALPVGATIKDLIITSSDETIAKNVNNKEVEFIAEGEVDITITEAETGVFTVVHFVVVGLNQEVIDILETIATETGLEFYKEYSKNTYRISYTSSNKDENLELYQNICETYGVIDECVIYRNESSFNETMHSAYISIGGYDFAVLSDEMEIVFGENVMTGYAIGITLLVDPDVGYLTPIGKPNYVIGETIALSPTAYYFTRFESSNPAVAVVDSTENSNLVTIVGAGEVTIYCYLHNGTALSYTFYVDEQELPPDLTDAILVDYSGNGYFSASMAMEGLTELYLLPTGELYLSEVGYRMPIMNLEGDIYYLPVGREEYMKAYFTLDEKGVMGEVPFTNMDEENRSGHGITRDGIEFDVELGVGGIAKISLGDPLNVDLYVGYAQTEEGIYRFAFPMGIYDVVVSEDGYEVILVASSGGGQAEQHSGMGLDYSQCDAFNSFFNIGGENPALFLVDDEELVLGDYHIPMSERRNENFYIISNSGVVFIVRVDYQNQLLVDPTFDEEGCPVGEYTPEKEGILYKIRVTVDTFFGYLKYETISLETGEVYHTTYVPYEYDEEYECYVFRTSAGLFGIELKQGGEVTIIPINARF